MSSSKMHTIRSNSESVQFSASNLLLFIIILVLFIIFFTIEHDIFYTVKYKAFIFEQGGASYISSGSSERQKRWFLLLLFSITLFIKGKGHAFIIRNSLGWLILANLLWAIVSYFWAEDPAFTGRRIILFLILNFTALSISMNVPLRQLPTIVFWITVPIPIIGFFSERVLGTWWLGDPGWRFSGTIGPGGQAMSCAMLFLAAATMTTKGGRLSRLMHIGVMFAAVVFLVLTKSRSPFIGTLIAFGIYVICTKKPSTFAASLYPIIVILGIMVLVFGFALTPFLISGINLGRQESLSGLSGRAELWEHASEYVKERPLLGSGFGGFWTEDRVLIFADTHRWRISDGHSIFADTLLDLGFIGLVIFVSLLIVALWKARGIYVNRGDEGGAFALSLLTLWMADGLWSSWVLARGLVTLLLFTVLFGVALETQRARRTVTANG